MNFCLLVTPVFMALVQTFAMNGFIAHNSTYPGSMFDELRPGDVIRVACEDNLNYYKVADVSVYKAVTPDEFFKDGKYYSGDGLYWRIYNHPGEIVLQTCVKKDGDYEWGRLFVTAEKVRNAGYR